MFENISKGEFYAHSDGGVFRIGNGAVANCLDRDKHFISYCFNLQQRYDISKLEEAVKLLELNSKPVTYFESVEISERIEQLLKEIKK